MPKATFKWPEVSNSEEENNTLTFLFGMVFTAHQILLILLKDNKSEISDITLFSLPSQRHHWWDDFFYKMMMRKCKWIISLGILAFKVWEVERTLAFLQPLIKPFFICKQTLAWIILIPSKGFGRAQPIYFGCWVSLESSQRARFRDIHNF